MVNLEGIKTRWNWSSGKQWYARKRRLLELKHPKIHIFDKRNVKLLFNLKIVKSIMLLIERSSSNQADMRALSSPCVPSTVLDKGELKVKSLLRFFSQCLQREKKCFFGLGKEQGGKGWHIWGREWWLLSGLEKSWASKSFQRQRSTHQGHHYNIGKTKTHRYLHKTKCIVW